MSLSNIFKSATGNFLNSYNVLNKINIPIRNSIHFKPEIQNFNKIQLAKFSSSSILKRKYFNNIQILEMIIYLLFIY